MNAILNVENISKSFGKSFGKQKVLDDVSLSINKQQILAIVGESGSGKTTLMRIIAGLEKADSGNILRSQKNINNLAPHKRGIGLVFQDYALFPHLNVKQNICFGLKGEDYQRVRDLLSLVQLPDLETRYPHELSGGQQQRIAIARALASQPDLLLLDEPFSSLDPIRRKSLRGHLRELVSNSNTSIFIITHDINDALKLADKMLVLHKGKVVQSGTPDQIKSAPASAYIEQLLE